MELLNFFASSGFKNLYAIDPSSAKFKKFYNKKINLITDYFSRNKVINYLSLKHQKFDLITSFAMFYDIENPNSFCKDINALLKKTEFGYLNYLTFLYY